MKKLIVWSGKVLIAGISAFLILTLITIFYCNTPASAKSADGETDYRYVSNTFFSRATEGFSIGRTNNDGYINSFEYTGGGVSC